MDLFYQVCMKALSAWEDFNIYLIKKIVLRQVIIVLIIIKTLLSLLRAKIVPVIIICNNT